MLFGWLLFLLIEVERDLMVLGFLFTSTLLTYTFQRYMKIHYSELLVGPRMSWMVSNLRFIKAILFVSLLSTIVFAMYLEFMSMLILAFLAAISFFYAFKFNLTSKRTNLRDIPGIKIFLIGSVWAVSCAIVPAIEVETLNEKTGLIGLGFLLYIIGITIPFDIRDVDVDEINKKTIPQLIGTKSAVILSILLVISSIFLMGQSLDQLKLLSVGVGISIIAVLLTKKDRDELFFSFILDGLLIILPISYWLLS